MFSTQVRLRPSSDNKTRHKWQRADRAIGPLGVSRGVAHVINALPYGHDMLTRACYLLQTHADAAKAAASDTTSSELPMTVWTLTSSL